ncbi:hypothetical protein NDU88_001188 [Pleurodeles waltl]|uniref:Uncharacterized protein n=1 Tax=Pleurodeles waltl TaxID=8319 RepID=A0AAV7LYT9_PLEWA|nr:hypothetical protein NDU88_001188 [Pleurodeles waltl]
MRRAPNPQVSIRGRRKEELHSRCCLRGAREVAEGSGEYRVFTKVNVCSYFGVSAASLLQTPRSCCPRSLLRPEERGHPHITEDSR